MTVNRSATPPGSPKAEKPEGEKRAFGSNFETVDAHVLGAADYADIPELTDADFARGIIHDAGVPRGRGRPPVENPKVLTSLRLDPEVLAFYRGLGPKWQAEVNRDLAAARKRREKARAKAG